MSLFAVEVENLTKRFGDFCAVDSLNFKVDAAKSSVCSDPMARASPRSSVC